MNLRPAPVRLAGRAARREDALPYGSARRAIGSAGERLVHTEEVTGSIPVSPTKSAATRILVGIAAGAIPVAKWSAGRYAAGRGDRFAESARYVRSYPEQLPQLAGLLPQIFTPVQIITGRNDPIVPVANAEFLHARLPNSRLDVLDAGHLAWEEAPAEYGAIIAGWVNGGYLAGVPR